LFKPVDGDEECKVNTSGARRCRRGPHVAATYGDHQSPPRSQQAI